MQVSYSKNEKSSFVGVIFLLLLFFTLKIGQGVIIWKSNETFTLNLKVTPFFSFSAK